MARATIISIIPAIIAFSAPLWGQAPDLRPGEGLAVIDQAGEVKSWGNTDLVSPMGNLAKILWLRLEGDEWEGQALETRCKGELNGIRCTNPKSHGRVSLAKSFKEDCNVAFYIWVNLSRENWEKDYGEGGAMRRLNDVFGPFLGDRLPTGATLPPMFGSEWFADGQLLQASPSQLARWLARPAQERLLAACRRHMLGFSDFVGGNASKWWIKVSEAPTMDGPGQEGGQKQYWALGGNRGATAILRLPPGTSRKDAETRFKALLNIKK
jgi:hypothetical protein